MWWGAATQEWGQGGGAGELSQLYVNSEANRAQVSTALPISCRGPRTAFVNTFLRRAAAVYTCFRQLNEKGLGEPSRRRISPHRSAEQRLRLAQSGGYVAIVLHVLVLVLVVAVGFEFNRSRFAGRTKNLCLVTVLD